EAVPVLDFLAIDQRKDTLRGILKFFKDRNSSWSKLQTIVVEKDFTEL
ncbi:TPA: hypothetical protein N0F65_012661, partial [Lagenidium giganteum]